MQESKCIDRVDPSEVAREYLREHQIDEIFQELGSALMYERPQDVNEFLLSKLKELKAKKERAEQTSIFNEQDLETLFSMYDESGTGSINRELCEHAINVLGIKRDCSDIIPSTDEQVSKDSFLAICTQALKGE